MSPISGTFFSAPSLPPFHFAPLPFLITQSAGYATVSNHTIYLSSVARLFSFYLLCHLHAYISYVLLRLYGCNAVLWFYL